MTVMLSSVLFPHCWKSPLSRLAQGERAPPLFITATTSPSEPTPVEMSQVTGGNQPKLKPRMLHQVLCLPAPLASN